MNKNPDEVKLNSIFQASINSILCDDAFTKEVMIQKIIQEYTLPIIILDFDLLYSGYVKSAMIKNRENVIVFNPKNENWQQILKDVLIKVSKEKCILIIDSLNGFFAIFDQKDSGQYADSCMMILSSAVKNSGNKIFLGSIARFKENNGWILHPTGRRVLSNKSISKFFITAKEIQVLSTDNKIQKVIKL